MAIKDKAASVLARLRNTADERNVSYQQVLLLFSQEEFMRRVAVSAYADNLVLKGGLLLYLTGGMTGRPTMDADFLLQHHGNDEKSLRIMLEDIISQKTENDFLHFEILSLKPIALWQHYHGMQAAIRARVKNIRIPLFIDFGVGDIIIPPPRRANFASLLSEQVAPVVLTYSLESTIAEKYDAIVLRREQTSRMKDFYDIFSLSSQRSFDGSILLDAVRQTLHYRGTPHTSETFVQIQALRSNADILKKWDNFLRDAKVKPIPFAEVMEGISRFLGPVVAAMESSASYNLLWTPEQGWLPM